MNTWCSCLVVIGACGPVMHADPTPRVERSSAFATPKRISVGRAEPEPEAPPFRDEDARCRRDRERALVACEEHPNETRCLGLTFETFWDPLARACRLTPDGGYSGAGCMSGGGGGLSVSAPPEAVGLRCATGTSWNGCSCECASRGDWDPVARRCEPPAR